MMSARSFGLCAGLAALALLAAGPRAGASEIATSEPGTTMVRDAAGDLQLVNCEGTQPSKPCTLGTRMSKNQPGWVDIASAEIRQTGADSVELSMLRK